MATFVHNRDSRLDLKLQLTISYSQNHWVELWVTNGFADFFNIFLLVHFLLTSNWLFIANESKNRLVIQPLCVIDR